MANESALAQAMRQMEPDKEVWEWYDNHKLLEWYVEAFYSGPHTFAVWYQLARKSYGEIPFPHEVFPKLEEIGHEIGFYKEVFGQE